MYSASASSSGYAILEHFVLVPEQSWELMFLFVLVPQ
jgi:hypothetical protein